MPTLPDNSTVLDQPLWLTDEEAIFPDPNLAMQSPNGLLAVGGELTPNRLLAAYKQGIFPWYDDDASPIMWWSPDPRAILMPSEFRLTRSLRKVISNAGMQVTADQNFVGVISQCRDQRIRSPGTWITPNMRRAYCQLFDMGYAHSVEVWLEQKLVGGLYGIACGKMFFGESMFSLVSNASKVAMAALCRQLQEWQYTCVDCQMMSDHIASLGARSTPRADFLQLLSTNNQLPDSPQHWSFENG